MKAVRNLVLVLSLLIGSAGGIVASGGSALAWPIRAVALLFGVGGAGAAVAAATWGRNYSVAQNGAEFANGDDGTRWVNDKNGGRPLG